MAVYVCTACCVAPCVYVVRLRRVDRATQGSGRGGLSLSMSLARCAGAHTRNVRRPRRSRRGRGAAGIRQTRPERTKPHPGRYMKT